MSNARPSGPSPKKSLGQHFLTDEEVVWRIVQAVRAEMDEAAWRAGSDGAKTVEGEEEAKQVKSGGAGQSGNADQAGGVGQAGREQDVGGTDRPQLVEIGPGTGALTRDLLAVWPRLTAVETDPRMVEVLERDLSPSHPGLRVLHRDVLRADWAEWLRPGAVLVGNLPYYATSAILFETLSHRESLSGAVFMVQKEVADRITALPGTRDYGILSVQLQLMSSPSQVFDVPPEAFDPPPKVTSAVVRLRFDRPALPCSDRALKQVVRTAFQQRRKKMSNAIRPLLDPARFPEFDFSLRPDAWTPQMYARLAEQFESLSTTGQENVKS